MTLPQFNIDTGLSGTGSFLLPGLAAAVVVRAINLIGDLAAETDNFASDIADEAIAEPILDMPDPAAAKVRWASSLKAANTALSPAMETAGGHPVQLPALHGDLLESAVASLTGNMLTAFDALFPGLATAGRGADSHLRQAFAAGNSGVTYVEQFDRAAADSVLAFGRLDLADQQGEIMATAAAAGHRFMPGVAHGAVAKLHSALVKTHDQAIASAYKSRVDAESAAKLALARAAAGVRASKIKDLAAKVADLFNKKRQARASQIADQDAVIDEVSTIASLTQEEENRVLALVIDAAKKHHAALVRGVQSSDYEAQKAKLATASGQEVVDMLGNMVTTLWNQVRGSGQFGGSERDVTDWS